MKCPDVPHVHKDLDCPCCSTHADYVMLKADEAVNCSTCGFEIAVPEDFVQYARSLFAAAAKANEYRNEYRSRGALPWSQPPQPRVIFSSGQEIRVDLTPGGFMITVKQESDPPPSLDWLDGLS